MKKKFPKRFGWVRFWLIPGEKEGGGDQGTKEGRKKGREGKRKTFPTSRDRNQKVELTVSNKGYPIAGQLFFPPILPTPKEFRKETIPGVLG